MIIGKATVTWVIGSTVGVIRAPIMKAIRIIHLLYLDKVLWEIIPKLPSKNMIIGIWKIIPIQNIKENINEVSGPILIIGWAISSPKFIRKFNALGITKKYPNKAPKMKKIKQMGIKKYT